MDRITTIALIAALFVLLAMKVAGADEVDYVDQLDFEMQQEELKARVDELEAQVGDLEDQVERVRRKPIASIDDFDWTGEEQ